MLARRIAAATTAVALAAPAAANAAPVVRHTSEGPTRDAADRRARSPPR